MPLILRIKSILFLISNFRSLLLVDGELNVIIVILHQVSLSLAPCAQTRIPI